ncbi:MAG: replicative DNA helicase [Clostridiales bacterium]|jgi:replicative DNA helicase|nr:replicative DNA helicase [Clostridiales bacterium]
MAQISGRRVPPQSIEAEMSALGCLLLDQDKLSSVMEVAKPDDFYREDHREIYHAILSLFEKSQPVDILTVGDQLKSRGSLERVGGMAYLGELASCVPTPENARHYAGIVAEKATLRKIISACSKIIEDCYMPGEGAVDVVEAAESAIFGIMEDRNRSGIVHVREIIGELYDRLTELYNSNGKMTGLPTGFFLLDEKTFGFHSADLILLAARPSVGKSALALNIAHFAAVRAKQTVAVFSLEMPRAQLVSRMICADEKIDSNKMRSGRLSDEDWAKVAAATGRMMEAPLYIDDTPGATAADIKAKCRRLKLERGLSLVVIDYLQLMQGQGRNRSENRQQEISEISRSLKLMAKELDVPVLALSQLSRAPEMRSSGNHRPMLSDLRESGAIEQDADIVMFLYRDEMYNEATDKPGTAELIIAKHRNGETGTIELLWQGAYTRFANLASNY